MRHRRRHALLLFVTACGSSWQGWEDVARVEGRTEVFVIGTLHGPLRHGGDYPHERIASLLREAAPDVVLVEVPPARMDTVRQAAASGGEDEWLASFPELPTVLTTAAELGVPVVPVSGWTPELTADWKAYWEAHPEGPEAEAYRRAAGQLARTLDDEGDDPEWIHSARYRRLTRWRDEALQTFAGEELGAAAPHARRRAHVRRIIDAIKDARGRRVAIVFDARRRWMIEEALEAEPEVTRLYVRGLLEELD